MPTFLSDALSDPEVVHDGAANLTGYSLSSTGVEPRHVAFKDGEAIKRVIVVPAGAHVTSPGNLFQAYPSGLTVESLTGDGTLVANVDYEIATPPQEAPDDAGE